jgi:hypothetical protein
MTETGEAVFLMYKYEGSTYKTTAESIWKNFGHDLKITSLELNNNVIKNFGIGNWEAASMVGGAFGGKIGIDFVLGDPWIFSALTGNIATSSGGGPYTHKFIDTAGTLAALAAQNPGRFMGELGDEGGQAQLFLMHQPHQAGKSGLKAADAEGSQGEFAELVGFRVGGVVGGNNVNGIIVKPLD